MREEGRSSHGDVHMMSGQGKEKVSTREKYIDPLRLMSSLSRIRKYANKTENMMYQEMVASMAISTNAKTYPTSGSVAWFQSLYSMLVLVLWYTKMVTQAFVFVRIQN